MAKIEYVEISDFLAFKGRFEVNFYSGVNVLIGDNGTGKTTLLKGMYVHANGINGLGVSIASGKIVGTSYLMDHWERIYCKPEIISQGPHGKYIPEKDILEHAKGLVPFIDHKPTGFSKIYRDVLIAAQDVPTNEQSEMQRNIGKKIVDLIGGTIEWDRSEGTYYTVKTDGKRIPFADEASGYKKLGFLGLLVASEQLKPGSILFWDEPENSLNPDIYPELVSILLELAQNDIQIFLATHDYNLARHLDVRKDKSIPVTFHNLVKTKDGGITCHSSPEYIKLPNNLLEKASEDLFEAVIANALGVQGDE